MLMMNISMQQRSCLSLRSLGGGRNNAYHERDNASWRSLGGRDNAYQEDL